MSKLEEVRKRAEDDLYFFACLVNPSYQYGSIHKEAYMWLQGNNDMDQLLLLPREHLKSHMIAVWCTWWITKHPDATILYVSATEDLATQQLSAIKGMLESEIHRKYWPDMIHPEEAKRAEWNVKNIKVDHPLRRKMGVRDRTVAARSVGSNTTGLHCSVLIFDDLVVPDNAYTEEGRRKVQAAYSQFSSVASTGCITKVVGTRYHGKDIYGSVMLKAEVEEFDSEGNVVGSRPLFEVFERQVEEDGQYLWPRSQNPVTKKWFGFNPAELAKKRAKYFAAGERAQYYAQYYNNPNDPESDALTSDKFQYYSRKYLREQDGTWYFRDKQLSIFAAGDLAYTDGTRSDYTAFAVVGLDDEGFIYILELDQFKTTKYDVIYKRAIHLHDKWKFKKLRMETNAGANLVVEYLKNEIRKEGKSLVVEGKRAEGEKTERCNSILLPRYENNTILHYEGGLITTYEEQVVLTRPTHDDLRDAVAAAIEISRPPVKRRTSETSRGNVIQFNPRFGGRVR